MGKRARRGGSREKEGQEEGAPRLRVLTAVAVAALASGVLGLLALARGGPRPAQGDGSAVSRSLRLEELQPGPVRRVSCHAKSYRPIVPGCTPAPNDCGFRIVDGLISQEEVDALRKIAQRGMALGGGAGGPTILDLHSGALSLEDKFIDVWMAFNLSRRKAYTQSELLVYHEVTQRLAAEVEATFGVSGVMLTSPTFFSRISADRPPRIPNDEYWHSHIDKQQYGSFVYTVLLYLSDQGVDFEGGSLCFDSPKTKRAVSRVAPHPGRAVLFTSGEEHPHHVEQVTSGSRLALTVAFTCNPDTAIHNFLGRALPDEGSSNSDTNG
ncbi:hypothetical protein AB1Y20_019475 [Prymnesium parvum]|uniref:Fe2OG dioxygenase domain-containing protein n=1 Tax=Prymnesium parvum TaxID=97485 RepID=A0AB34JSN7_PRYPA